MIEIFSIVVKRFMEDVCMDRACKLSRVKPRLNQDIGIDQAEKICLDEGLEPDVTNDSTWRVFICTEQCQKEDESCGVVSLSTYPINSKKEF